VDGADLRVGDRVVGERGGGAGGAEQQILPGRVEREEIGGRWCAHSITSLALGDGLRPRTELSVGSLRPLTRRLR
jgi:hypothetical protein